MAVRKAETVYLGDATSVVKAAGVAVKANADYAAKAKMSAEQIIAAQDSIAAAGDKAAKAAVVAGKTQSEAAVAAGRAAMDEAKAVDVSTAQQVASYRKAAAAAQAGAGEQVAAGKKSAVSIAGVGSAMSKMTLPILAVAGASAVMAAKFQASTERLRTQAGATQAQVEKLRQGILNMAGSVAIGPNQLTAGMYHVVSSMNAVLPASQRVSGELTVLKDAAKLTAVGGSDLEQTTYALASAMNALHAPISQAGKITGQLNAIVGAGDMTMTDLIDSFQSGLVPAAKQVGLSLQSLGAPLAVMGDMGMRGALAGTRLRMSIALLSAPSKAAATVLDTLGMSSKQAVSTSDAMSAALEKAGLRTTTLSADLKKPDGFMVALQDLNTHLRESGLTATGAAAVMGKAFGGGKMGATITLLAENTGRLQTKFQQIGQTTGQFGAAFAATTQTASFKWHALLATVESDGIRLGNVVLPVLLGVGKEIVGVVTTVSRAFQSLPSGVQKAIITGGLMVAAIGPALTILGVFTSGIAKMVQVAKLVTGARVIGASTGAAGAGTASTAAGASAATSGGIVSGIKSVASKAVGGLAIAGLGVMLSQTIGTAIHGAAGQAVKTIGTDTAIGAGLGSIFGPAGMAGGAIIGGLVGSITAFTNKHANDEGNAWGKEFTKGMGPLLPSTVGTQRAAAKSQKVVQGAKSDLSAAQLAPGSLAQPGQQSPAQIKKDAIAAAKLWNAEFQQAWKDAKLGVVSLKAIKFPNAAGFAAQINQTMMNIATSNVLDPAQKKMGESMAETQMVNYAATLVREKKLPLSALGELISQIQQEWGPLSKNASTDGAAIAKNLVNTQAFNRQRSSLKGVLNGLQGDFGGFAKKVNANGSNIMQVFSGDIKELQTRADGSSGAMRQRFLDEIQTMHDKGGSLLAAMAKQAQSKMAVLSQAIAGGSASATNAATGSFKALASNVAIAMSSGTVSAAKGTQMIMQALKAELNALGAAPIPEVALKSLSAKQLMGEQNFITGGGSSNAGPGHNAGGGIVQFGEAGAKGHDNIPVNFGGQHIAVGSGEVGMVANGPQQAFLNARTADVGGLRGVFQKMRKPHYMASGGVASGWQNVIASAESLGGDGYKGNPIQADGYSELGVPPTAANVGTAMGRLPYQTHMRIRSGSHQVVASKQDIGTGSSFNPVMGLYPGTVRELGLSGGQFRVSIERADGVPLTVGSGGGGGTGGVAPTINAPSVKGTGAIAGIVKAGIGKATAAANKYLQAHAPAPSSSGGGGGSGPVFPVAPGKVPTPVQWALSAAQAIAAKNLPYGHMGAGWDLPAYDCSSYVSTVMDAAGIWPRWAYYTAADPINQHTLPGPGKWITIATKGTSGNNAHTMMEIDGHFFESSGQGNGPHVDSGWSEAFDQYRHPSGWASGGMTEGQPGHQPTNAQAGVLSRGGAAAKKLIAMLNPGLKMASGGKVAGSKVDANQNPQFEGYEPGLQKKFSNVTNMLGKMWKAAAPLYHRAAGSAMPKVTYTQGLDGLIVGVDQTPGQRPGHRDLYFPDWFVQGVGKGKNFQSGLKQLNPTMLEVVPHEWTHEFQDVPLLNKFDKMIPQSSAVEKNGGVTEGGAEAIAKMFGKRVLAAIGVKDTAGPETSDQMYYAPEQFVMKKLGKEWIENGQFGYGPSAKAPKVPFAGSFKNGGTIPFDGMAMVHKNETVIPAAKGYLGGVTSSAAAALYPIDALINALTAKLTQAQNETPVGASFDAKKIAGLEADLVEIRKEKITTPAGNAKQITTLQGQLTDISKQRTNLPTPASGKKGDAQRQANDKTRKDLANQTLDIETKIKKLKADDKTSAKDQRAKLAQQTLDIETKIKSIKGDDKAAKATLATTLKNITARITSLNQLKAFKDAITSIKVQTTDLASQAAAAWRTVQETAINTTHDATVAAATAANTAAHAAIASGPDSTALAGLQATDAAEADANTMASNAQGLTDAQNALVAAQGLVAHSGGQAHVDAVAALPAAVKAVKDAQDAIDAYARQKQEATLQASIDAANTLADDTLTTATTTADNVAAAALAGLDQQQADYQAFLDAEMGALDTNLANRKISYATWAADVNAILAPYGLSASTDPTTEGTVDAGPGPAAAAPTKAAPKNAPVNKTPAKTMAKNKGIFARAFGGSVAPNYVYRVGEQGPEDVMFGQSGTVMTTTQTRGNNGGGPSVHIEHATFSGTQAAKAFGDRIAFRAAIGTA